jgi:DNA-binding NtrC family response regulator
LVTRLDYISKPVIVEDLLQKVRNLVEYGGLRDEVRRLRRDIGRRLGFEGLVGRSSALAAVFELVEKVAPTNATVLVTGESGTGKELVARAVHARSALREREFLAVNMAAVPAELVEAQLFGHERGAFTGADRRREGILRSVRGGTVFLDELGDLPMPAQAKLLRAIESHEVMPVGADRPSKADFRLIAATNHDLETAVREGRFRQDLFFRLNVFRVPLPPLRERREDIPALVSHFVDLHARAQNRRPLRVSDEALQQMLGYAWPGNVRELSNVIERASILAGGGVLGAEHLPAELRAAGPATLALRPAVEAFEASHVRWVLAMTGGNRERAAKLLDVDPATLYRRLAKYSLE